MCAFDNICIHYFPFLLVYYLRKGVYRMLDPVIVGRVIQRCREQKGLSQEVVSGLAGIGRTHLSAIERGARKPTLETLYRIGEALSMQPSALLAMIEEEMFKIQS